MGENLINLGIKIMLPEKDLNIKKNLNEANKNLVKIDESLKTLEDILEKKKQQNNENNYKYKISSYLLFCSFNKEFEKKVSSLIKEKLNIKDNSKLINENNIELLMKDENNRNILEKFHNKYSMNNRII